MALCSAKSLLDCNGQNIYPSNVPIKAVVDCFLIWSFIMFPLCSFLGDGKGWICGCLNTFRFRFLVRTMVAFVLLPCNRSSMPACLTVVPGAADSSLYYPYPFTVILMDAKALNIIVIHEMYVKICLLKWKGSSSNAINIWT